MNQHAVHLPFTSLRNARQERDVWQREARVFVLVRHAHAGSKRRWRGPDDERPLSRRGERQAAELARLLRGLGVSRLLSSPALRCRQSLAVASDVLWLPIEPVQALSVGASPDELLELLASRRVDGAALCTHRETLRTLSEAWATSAWTGAQEEPPDLSRTPKGASWVVANYPGHGARAQHMAGDGGASGTWPASGSSRITELGSL